ncbi:MAG: indolepyruvate ferredoxin oxidoreductase family protein [Acidimicrobiales bacterium]|nr:indolepyruvate ferredoxin oxidoreductase family protein [Acidimicrobiales bacterium]
MTGVIEYQLTDRYINDAGRVLMTGVQALARLPIEQLRIDRANGLNTAAFISGYPGSPLGGYDQEVARAARTVPDLPIICQPGVNEELGATAVMGSQLAAAQPDFNRDGVLGIWYGKAPGLDRASDAIRHAVFAGTSRYGGAIALVGDDAGAKSSTLPTSSDATIYDLHMPLFYPGDVQETVDLGRHAVVLSRLSGLWTSMKIVSAVADGNGTVDLDIGRVVPIIPDLSIPGDPNGEIFVPHPSGRLLTPYTLALEEEFRNTRLVLAERYAVANGLNRVTVNPSDAWIGLVATGHTYHELLEALRRLGLETASQIEAAGIRLIQMQMPLSVDRQNIRRFARGLAEIVVVEEKNPTLEWLVKNALYGGPDQPRVVGKQHEDGRMLMKNYGLLDAGSMVEGLRQRLAPRIGQRLAPAPPPHREKALIPLAVKRTPYFCSGCPHNHSTKVPDGALVGAGIGCHGMVLLMDEEKVGDSAGIGAMGGEGVQWIGMSPFLERDHFIQNLGDGTFFHSGQLAIQASIAAGVNTTYKLLFNGTVAMTGGQSVEGSVGVPEITSMLYAHGAKEILITTDDVEKYKGVELPDGPAGRTKVWDRSRMIEAQEHLAAVQGVTILIHDQACAAQLRRERKRGTLVSPTERVVINHRICEACGDCGEVSNCLSVQPVQTPLGVKTTIDQSSCNLDMSCLAGDCPSFMTVSVDDAERATPTAPIVPSLPDPSMDNNSNSFDVHVVGIGGTGVVTASQIIGTAAMLDGYAVRGLDQTGLSQKAGQVSSDIRLRRNDAAQSNLIGDGGADLILGFDLLAAASPKSLMVGEKGRTVMIASATETPTGSMVGRPDIVYPSLDELRDRVSRSTRPDKNRFVDAGRICNQFFGGTASANIFLIGVAIQAEALPVSPNRIEEAIRLNGVAVETNLAAFAAGRHWVQNSAAYETSAQSGGLEVVVPELSKKLRGRVEGKPDVVALLAADLAGYQDEKYAGRFLDLVDTSASVGGPELVEAVARGYHKLLAYKDEYEVARLLIGPEAEASARAVGGEGAEVTWRLHPPMLKALGMHNKMEIPAKLGVPAMKALAKGKRLRGTRLDPFGRAEVRVVERAMIDEFQSAMLKTLARLERGEIREEEAIRIASLPMAVRGYEDLKLRRAATFREALQAL